MSNRRVLMVVRAGDRSLHPQWLKNTDRSFDLHVSYFGDLQNPYEGACDGLERAKGSKWTGLTEFLLNNPRVCERYDYIAFPDDDILTTQEDMDRLVTLLLTHRPHLAQPSLTLFSYFSHKVTLTRPCSEARETNFVEIMFPCFRTDFLTKVIDSFALNSSGWGLESLWYAQAKELFKEPLFIIFDAVAVHHTRPVGRFGSGGAVQNPHFELQALLESRQLSEVIPRSLGVKWSKRILQWCYLRSYFLIRNLGRGKLSMTVKSF